MLQQSKHLELNCLPYMRNAVKDGSGSIKDKDAEGGNYIKRNFEGKLVRCCKF